MEQLLWCNVDLPAEAEGEVKREGLDMEGEKIPFSSLPHDHDKELEQCEE
jgi:hypothetical protein